MRTYKNIGQLGILSASESESAAGAIACIDVNPDGIILIDKGTRLYTNGHLVPNLDELIRWFKASRGVSVDVNEITKSGFPFAETARFTSDH